MIKHIIIENEREVDLAYSEKMLAQRQNNGWKFVVDCSDWEWPRILDEVHKRADQSGKRCHLPKPVSKEERRRILYRVYRDLFGVKLWNMLGELYQKEPEKAIELAQKVLREMRSTNNKI